MLTKDDIQSIGEKILMYEPLPVIREFHRSPAAGNKNMDGICDVKGCNEATYLGWRPLTERHGRQICEYHWNRHKDETDSFDLYEAFKFRRPIRIPRRLTRRDKGRCACGRVLEDGHRFCKACIEERERRRKREAYHERKNPEPEQITRDDTPGCKACGEPREPGHTYCPECAERRKKQSNRERRRRSYRKTVKCGGLV
jgi:hypothetical protein